MISVSLIVVGVLLIITGVVVFPKQHLTSNIPVMSDELRLEVAIDTAISDGVLTLNERNTIRKVAQDTLADADLAVQRAEKKLAELKLKPETEIIDQYKKSGNDFEKFIVQKFSPKYYKIKEWAGDKYVEGRYAETSTQPDLLMELNTKGKSHIFAVECKWRKRYGQSGIEFATDDQLERYKKYEKDKGIPVFIAIGIGGEGDNPEQLYVIPLKRLKYRTIGKDYLVQFEKEKGNDFFYDNEKQLLR